MILETGFHPDIPDSIYFQDPCLPLSLTASICKVLISKSPLHAYNEHPKLGGGMMDDDDSDDDKSGVKAFGTIVHSTILGKGAKVVLSPFKSFQSNDAKAWKAQQIEAGNVIAKQKQLDKAQFMRDSVRSALDAAGLSHAFVGPEGVEETLVWKERDQFWMRSRLDHWHNETATIFDLKTCESAHEKAISNAIHNYKYALQNCFYRRGIAALRPELNGRTNFLFVFIETSAPYACQIVKIDGEAEAIGESQLARAVETWRQCLTLNQWPSYSSGVVRIGLPSYALNVELGAP